MLITTGHSVKARHYIMQDKNSTPEPTKCVKAEMGNIFSNISSHDLFQPNLDTSSAPAGQMLRYNEGKPKVGLLPFELIAVIGPLRLNLDFILDVAKVLTFGASKYAAWNWTKAGSWVEVVNSAGRHALSLTAGEAIDSDSGLPHAAHIGCNIAFLLTFRNQMLGIDDRWQAPVPLSVRDSDPHEILLHLAAYTAGGEVKHLHSILQILSETYDESL